MFVRPHVGYDRHRGHGGKIRDRAYLRYGERMYEVEGRMYRMCAVSRSHEDPSCGMPPCPCTLDRLTLPRLKPRDSGFIAPCRRGQVPLGLTEAPPALTCGVSHRARLASETVVERCTRRTALRNRQRPVGKEQPMVWYLPILPKGHPRPPPDHCATYRTQSDSFHPTAQAGGAGEIFPLAGSL